MGITSWRGKGSEERVTEKVATTGSEISPERDLRNFKKHHQWDPFLEIDKLDAVDDAITTGDTERKAAVEDALLLEDSPYPEVRSSVRPFDDPEMPVDTIRAWVLGGVMCTVVAALNLLLGLRISPITISSTVVQLIAYPIGCAWARFVPTWTIRFLGRDIPLNPGPFNVKEHTLVTIMTAAGASSSYAIDILLAQEVFYQQYFQWGFQMLLILSTQALGFGLAGVLRRFLIYPASMVWPATLVFATVINSLHDHSSADPTTTNGWKISRYIFFLIISGLTFAWEWVPQVMAQFLQYFMWVVWIAPDNVVVNQVFGGFSGLGILPMSFDWGIISGFLGSPLQTPSFAIWNAAAGMIFTFIAMIGLAYGGPDYYRYLPISANANFDHFGQPYNTSKILNPDITFNETAYKEYSPLFLGPAFSLSYGLGFAALISTIVHVALFYGRDIWDRTVRLKDQEPDIHMKLMQKYREAPEWWFLAVFAISFAFGLAASVAWDTHLPWWAYIISLLIGSVLALPVGIIQAITNQQTGLNVITEMIYGYMQPGRPVATMMFKSYGYMMCSNSLSYIADMKIGHYMKIPPRAMFRAQLYAVVWLSVVQVATYNFLRNNIEGICTRSQTQGLTCPNAKTYYNASVIWGVLGPARMFGASSIYSWTNYFWLIGAALPTIQYFLARRYPRSIFRYIFFPTIFGVAGMIPPATAWYIGQWVIVGFIFNVWIRSRYFGWWKQYIYVLSGALDIGTALVIAIAALALGISGANFPDWWGNTVFSNNLDSQNAAVTKTLPDDTSFFGPTQW